MALFLFDECLPRPVAEALAIVGYPVYHVENAPGLQKGVDDPHIIEWCGKNGATLVTKDEKLERTKHYLPMIKGEGISIAWFKETKPGWSNKEWLYQFARRMREMESNFSSLGPIYLRYTSKGKPKRISL